MGDRQDADKAGSNRGLQVTPIFRVITIMVRYRYQLSFESVRIRII